MIVPAGKRIKIYKGSYSWLNPYTLNASDTASNAGDAAAAAGDSAYSDYIKEIPMYLGEDLSVKTASEFGSPFQGMQEGAVSIGLLGQFVGAGLDAVGLNTRLSNMSAQSRFSSYQFWKYSQPITLSVNIKFYMGIAGIYKGKQEVYLPSMRLSEIVLPTKTSDGIGLQAPGPTAGNFLAQSLEGSDNDMAQKVRGNLNTNSSAYSVYIGNILYLEDAVIKGAEVTYSKEVDTDGYPISSNVMLEISSTTVGTTNMLRQSLESGQKSEQKKKMEDEAELAVESSLSNTIINWTTKLLGG